MKKKEGDGESGFHDDSMSTWLWRSKEGEEKEKEEKEEKQEED
jgi:hypothetical protein